MLAVVALKQPAIETLCVSLGMNEVNNPCYSRGLDDPRIAELCKMTRSFSIKLHSATQVSSHLGMSGG